MGDQEYIPSEQSRATTIRAQLIETLRERGAEGGVIPMSLARRIDPQAYPGKHLDVDGVDLWVKP